MLVPIYFTLGCQSACWLRATPGVWWGGCSQTWEKVAMPMKWLLAGSNTASLLGCHSKVCHPQPQVFMFPFKLSSSQKSLCNCLICLAVISSNLCHCYSPHGVLSFGQRGSQRNFASLITSTDYTHFPLGSPKSSCSPKNSTMFYSES